MTSKSISYVFRNSVFNPNLIKTWKKGKNVKQLSFKNHKSKARKLSQSKLFISYEK